VMASFFGMHAVYNIAYSYRFRKRSMAITLLDHFNNILKKKSLFGEKESFPIKTMHGFTRARHRWPNSTNSAMNCFFSIFARFSRAFPVSKSEEMVQRKEIHHQRAPHRRNRGLF